MCLCNYGVVDKLMLSVIFIIIINVVGLSGKRIYFPDDIVTTTNVENEETKQLVSEQTDDLIPMEVIMKLNSIQNLSQLYDEFDIKDETSSNTENNNNNGKEGEGNANRKSGVYGMASKLRTAPYMSDRSGGIEEEIKAIDIGKLNSRVDNVARFANLQTPEPAICKPELQTVSIYTPEDRRTVAYPTCTRVERCGGCCQHERLSCQPTKTETLNYKVVVMKWVGGQGFSKTSQEIVPVDKHTACRCSCIIKQEHCNPLQEYREKECRCVCTNKDEEQKCKAESKKIWESDTCQCQCKEVLECSSTHFFSEETCSCETIRAITLRGSSKEDKFNYNVYKVLPNLNLNQGRHQI